MKGSKKIIRRRPGRKRNMYFNMDTQAAIIKFQEEESPKVKIKIYEKEILPAFQKLSESLIYTYKFNSPTISSEELAADCVSFLYSKIYKWHKEKKSKAYSYFNVVGKNWLINTVRKHHRKASRCVSLSDFDTLSKAIKAQVEHHSTVPSPDETMVKREQKNNVLLMLEDMRIKLASENELACLQAIETLFVNIENLELLNKRAILVYIKEISGLNKKNMSKGLLSIRRHYKEMTKLPDSYDLFF